MTQNYIDLSKDFERISRNIGAAGDIRACVSDMWCMAQIIKNHPEYISSESINKLQMYLFYVNGAVDIIPKYLEETKQIIKNMMCDTSDGFIIRKYNCVPIIPNENPSPVFEFENSIEKLAEQLDELREYYNKLRDEHDN